MNKNDIQLKSFKLLSKDIDNNLDLLKTLIINLCVTDPNLAFRCWDKLIKSKIEMISIDFDKESYPDSSVGKKLIDEFEKEIFLNINFEEAAKVLGTKKSLINILFTQSPINASNPVFIVLSYLIREGMLEEAKPILQAIYKNKNFKEYSLLWKNITDLFQYKHRHRYPYGYLEDFNKDDSNFKRDEKTQDFCINWAQKIPDLKQQAEAVVYIMRMA